MKEHASKGIAVLLVCLGLSVLIATIVCSVLAVRWSNAELERERLDERARAIASFKQVQDVLVKTIQEIPNPERVCGDRLVQVVSEALEKSVGPN